MVSVEATTIIDSTFIPFELYLTIFIATLTFLALSLMIKRHSRIFFAGVAMLLSFFSTYATFVLGKTDDITLIFNETTGNASYYTLDTIYTIQPLLLLCVGLSALCVLNLWIGVFYLAEDMKSQTSEEIEDTKMINVKDKKQGELK
jgi:hypothetical protein